MNMKKIFKRTSLLLATALIGVTVQAQKSPQDMDRFIDALMRRMTVEEKIGQLNLPVTGEITTGQAKSSDVAKKIEQGLVGGLFNLKGVAKIRDVQKLAVENSRLGIPLLFGMDVIHGYETIFPHPPRPLLHVGHGSHRAVCPHRRHRSQCRRYLMDIQSDGRHQP